MFAEPKRGRPTPGFSIFIRLFVRSKWLQMALNGSKWLQMAPIGSKWLQMTPNDSKWAQMAENGSKWLNMAPNGSKWLQMAQHGSKWLQRAPNDSKWLQMTPNISNISVREGRLLAVCGIFFYSILTFAYFCTMWVSLLLAPAYLLAFVIGSP